jgi:hypothetical protein
MRENAGTRSGVLLEKAHLRYYYSSNAGFEQALSRRTTDSDARRRRGMSTSDGTESMRHIGACDPHRGMTQGLVAADGLSRLHALLAGLPVSRIGGNRGRRIAGSARRFPIRGGFEELAVHIRVFPPKTRAFLAGVGCEAAIGVSVGDHRRTPFNSDATCGDIGLSRQGSQIASTIGADIAPPRPAQEGSSLRSDQIPGKSWMPHRPLRWCPQLAVHSHLPPERIQTSRKRGSGDDDNALDFL